MRDAAGTSKGRARLAAESVLSRLPGRAACAPRGVAARAGFAACAGRAACAADSWNVGGAVVVAPAIFPEVLIAGTIGG